MRARRKNWLSAGCAEPGFKNMRNLRVFIIDWVGPCLLPFSLFLFGVYFILTSLHRFLRAEVLYLPGRLNFGNTAFLPDMVRRMHPGRHLVFALFRDRGLNPYMRRVWEGVEGIDYMDFPRFVIDVTLRGRRVIIPSREIHDRIIASSLKWVAQRFGKNPYVLANRKQVFEEVSIPPKLQDEIDAMLQQDPLVPSASQWAGTLRYSLYWNLRREHEMPPPFLPSELKERVESALVSARKGREAVRSCGHYLKCTGSEKTLPEDGSPLEAYLPAVEMLVDHGYQVLVSGDRELPDEFAETFGGMLVDARRLGIDPYLFSLYSSFNADIFIGENGGGLSLAEYNETCPRLALNIWPFWSAIDGWVYYKQAFDSEGLSLEFSRIAGELAFAYPEEDKFSVVQNSADEISEAVKCFLEEVENPGSSDIDREMEYLWPSYSFFGLADCHISPAYVQKYRRSFPADKFDAIENG